MPRLLAKVIAPPKTLTPAIRYLGFSGELVFYSCDRDTSTAKIQPKLKTVAREGSKTR